ncbi:GNAT family N-acetyltransferase [Dyella telluris]|uniref:GNAT family N-acetyltransferase n=1 Tax=Dyella telluris TaxID=2763498 RepID=A0A7G8Q236_9GAMM|nr:GNAT family N-acetyltransferase [Dyella telluris]QNK00844.1 GNAT family N-acetyltransferase [Dyella telluris]
MEPVLTQAVPGNGEYRALRAAAGLSQMSEEGAALGLPASWSSVCVRHDGELVGMGRIVGDGGLFLFVVDIAVTPAWQGKGLGRRIMQALMDDVHARAPSRTMVGLIADGTAHELYAKFGFRLVAPGAHGMLLRLS